MISSSMCGQKQRGYIFNYDRDYKFYSLSRFRLYTLTWLDSLQGSLNVLKKLKRVKPSLRHVDKGICNKKQNTGI